jgi:hypothetical protein
MTYVQNIVVAFFVGPEKHFFDPVLHCVVSKFFACLTGFEMNDLHFGTWKGDVWEFSKCCCGHSVL